MTSPEEVAIVDENDQIIGYKLRSELLTTDRIRIINIWIANDKREVLIARRAKSRLIDPDCWGPAVAGTVQKNHSYLDTAQRELAEELGITDVELSEYNKESYVNSRGRARVCQWFTLRWNGHISELAIQTDEVAAAKWIAKDKLKHEIKAHPEKFVASAAMWVELFNL